jgi:GxxExxY protein
MDVEEVATIAIECGLRIHRTLGPGLLESAYEAVLAHALEQRGLFVERQRLVPISFEGLVVEGGFRADLLIENCLLIELKSIDRLAPVHKKQVLTYLRFLDLRLGLLMNFGGETLKDGLQRIVNHHHDVDKSPLGINRVRPS